MIALALAARAAVAAPVDDLASPDSRAVAAAVTAIERAPSAAEDLFAAARACEQGLQDPARAAALYERVAHDWPDSSVAMAAARRAEQLRVMLGPNNSREHEARAFAEAVAHADADPDAAVRAVDELAAGDWPGAPDALLWAGELLRERGRYVDAQDQYAMVRRRWPSSPQGFEAMREAAGCAVEAHDWSRALALAKELPGGNPLEDAARDELIAAARRGMRRDTIGQAAWLALALALLVLLASLADATFRGGWRRPRLRPPIEVMFLAPIAAVFVAIAFAAQRVIAPAVARITVTGIVLAWISGAALDLLRARGRATRGRSLVHIGACLLGVIAIAYLALVRDGLLDMLVETARYGPDR